MVTIRLRNTVRGWKCALIAGLLLAVVCASADAGLLATGTGAMPGQHGGVYDIDGAGFYVADVEYAVYKDSAPLLGLSYPGRYIYAYQLFNQDVPLIDAQPLTTLSVGVVTESYDIQDTGWLATGLEPPYTALRSPSTIGGTVGSNSVYWNFDTNGTSIRQGEQSDILYFTSSHTPGTSVSSITGTFPVNLYGFLPSPVPEPGAGMLGIAAVIGVGFVIAARRSYNRCCVAGR